MSNINIENIVINDDIHQNKLLYSLPKLYKARIVKRPSSKIKSPYVADIILIDSDDENIYLGHCPSLGCSGLCENNCIVYVSKNESKNTKCDYVVQQAFYEENDKQKNIRIATSPKLGEKITRNALLQHCFEDLDIKDLQAEKCFKNSRFDFCGTLNDDNETFFILEVKTVPIARYEDIIEKQYNKNFINGVYENRDFKSKIALFPVGYRKNKNESMSPRAIKHLEELVEIKKENPNYRVIMCYVIPRIDITTFSPSIQDTFYYDAFKNAIENGVEVKTLTINWIDNNAFLYNNQCILQL
jgi:DNA-binding sugar fermentation-stimulating protein